MNDFSNVSNHVIDFLVYTDKSKSLILLILSFFLGALIVYFIYVLITEPLDNESENKITKLQKFVVLLAFIFGLLVCIELSLKNISYFFQKEPELVINKQGITFHTLGFLSWSEIDRIKPVHKGRRRSNIFKVILKSDSKWQPKSSSFFSPSTFSDNSITVKKALDVNLNDLFNTLHRLKPPTKMHE